MSPKFVYDPPRRRWLPTDLVEVEIVIVKRTEWEFTYTVGRVLEAAQSQLAYYKERLAWWTAKKDETLVTVRESGIEIDESVGAEGGPSKYSNSYRGESVSIRNDLVQDLNECVGKVAEHRGRIQIMDGWVEVLAAQSPDAALILHHDDWLFFFSKK